MYLAPMPSRRCRAAALTLAMVLTAASIHFSRLLSLQQAPAGPSGLDVPLHRAELPALADVADPIALSVVYPALTDMVRVRDSSFLFGSVASGSVRLTINGTRVRVWPNGAWLAWLPFPPESLMRFRIEARLAGDSSVLTYPVRRDPRYFPLQVTSGSAWIDSVSLSPKGQLWLPRSEYLTFSARAAEGSVVRLHLPDGQIVRLQPERQF